VVNIAGGQHAAGHMDSQRWVMDRRLCRSISMQSRVWYTHRQHHDSLMLADANVSCSIVMNESD
jgi:hypothetical protein